jgi:protein-disulfide isomerase
MSRVYSQVAAIAVLMVVAVAMGMAAVRRLADDTQRSTDRPRPHMSVIANVQSLHRGDLHLGRDNSPLTILEFSDFQCPFCADAARHRDSVGVIFRHFPRMQIHPVAFGAAIAAECAAAQHAFERFHDTVFDDQALLTRESLTLIAASIGVRDTLAFARCLTADSIASRVRADLSVGDSLHLPGTPILYVGSTMIAGAPSIDLLDSLVTTELARYRSGRMHSSTQP